MTIKSASFHKNVCFVFGFWFLWVLLGFLYVCVKVAFVLTLTV